MALTLPQIHMIGALESIEETRGQRTPTARDFWNDLLCNPNASY